MYAINQVFVGKEFKVFYDRKLTLGNKYKFLSKSAFIDFFDRIMKLIVSSVVIQFKAELLTEFGDISVSKQEDFELIINNSESIYRINVEVIGEDAENTYTIVAKFSELESFRDTSFIRLISTDKKWIEETEKSIHEKLSLYKNMFSFASSNFFKVLLLGTIQYLIFKDMFGADFSKNINPLSFLAFLAYTLLIILVFMVIEDTILPTFKINAKASMIKRFVLRLKQDVFFNTIAILSFIVGVISFIISVVK